MNTQKQILLIVILFFTFVGGCAAYSIIDLPYRAGNQADYQKSESIERGALLFANNCRTCHGIRGEGHVGPQLNKPEFQNQDPLVLAANRALLTTTLTCGRAGTLMPAWLNTNGGSLNAIQLQHLVDLITAPAEEGVTDAEGNPTNKGWEEAVEFAHNLNHESNALVGGDTLDTIAKQHNIGYQQLADMNNVPATGNLQAGTTLQMPGFKTMPDGYVYHVYNDNETVTKIADSQHVGALMIADLNNIPYKFSVSKDKTDFTLLDDKGTAVPGLFPGTELKLPEGATYTVRSGDTLDAIATQHGVSTSAIKDLNPEVLGSVTDTKAPLNSERKLKLPEGTKAILGPGQTLGAVATSHGLKVEDLESANNITPGQPAPAGAALTLPPNTQYTIQTGDTLASVAAAHGITVDALAAANNLKPTDPISPDVIIKLPTIDKYMVAGQTLDEIAKGFSNVTAESLAEANGIPANAILRVGQKLALPEDAFGTAPPNTLNPGTACVQHAITNTAFEQLTGAATPEAEVTPPATQAKAVTIEAHADDWTVTADGQAQAANKGVVSIAKGTAVTFDNKQGLHTIDINGKKDGENFKQGETRTITFADTGAFKITCEFHPNMLADVFVQ